MPSYQDDQIGCVSAGNFESLVQAVVAVRAAKGIPSTFDQAFHDVSAQLAIANGCISYPSTCTPCVPSCPTTPTPDPCPPQTYATIYGLIQAGENVTFTGNGTKADPFIVNAEGGEVLWGEIGGDINNQADLVAALAAIVSSGVPDGNKGDITVSGSGLAWTINAGSVENSMLAGGITTANLADGASFVTLTGSQTLTNKTLTSPVMTGPTLGTPVSGNFSSGTFTWPTFNQNTTGNAATVTTINGKITAGTNVTITGSGTSGDPYVVNSSGGSGSGTVTSVSVDTANGVSGSVANATTTPAITITLGAITPSSVAASGTVTGSNLSGTNTGDQTSIVGITGTKAQFDTACSDGNFLYVGDVTSNATHTGDVTGATALTIANDAVTFAKMQNLSDETRLIGRGQGAFGGDPEEITLGSGLVMTGTAMAVDSAEAATASKIVIRSGTGVVNASSITATGGQSTLSSTLTTGVTEYGNSATWTYGTGRAFLHSNTLNRAYLTPQSLTSSASISADFASGSQMDLTQAHNATLTLSNVADGDQGTIRGVVGGSGGYTLALAHSGLTMRQMGQPLSDIAGLAAGQWYVIAYLRAGSNLFHWVTTL